jgi:hypothetical protein
MARWSYHRLVPPVMLGVLLATGACNKENPQTNEAAPNIGGPGVGGPGGPPSPLRQAMNKIGKGPQSLNTTIERELKSEPPPWETLQPQAKAYADLAASLGQYNPPKGSKDSWVKRTGEFASAAEALNKAVADKNKMAALTAHAMLADSCQKCHDEHRGGPGRRMGRPGGFAPPQPPPGGPPSGNRQN